MDASIVVVSIVSQCYTLTMHSVIVCGWKRYSNNSWERSFTAESLISGVLSYYATSWEPWKIRLMRCNGTHHQEWSIVTRLLFKQSSNGRMSCLIPSCTTWEWASTTDFSGVRRHTASLSWSTSSCRNTSLNRCCPSEWTKQTLNILKKLLQTILPFMPSLCHPLSTPPRKGFPNGLICRSPRERGCLRSINT